MIECTYLNDTHQWVLNDGNGVELPTSKRHYGCHIPHNFVEPLTRPHHLSGLILVIGKSKQGKTHFVHNNFNGSEYILIDETSLMIDLKEDFVKSTMDYKHGVEWNNTFRLAQAFLNSFDKTKRTLVIDSASLISREGEQADAGHITHEWSKLMTTTSLAARSVDKTIVMLVNPMSSKDIIIEELLEKANQACVGVFDCTRKLSTLRFIQGGRDWQPFDPYSFSISSLVKSVKIKSMQTEASVINIATSKVAAASSSSESLLSESYNLIGRSSNQS